MKNLIRKILKEESNDINWIKDTVTTKLSGDEDWILVNDVDPKSLEVSHQIQQYLFDLGYSWNTDDSKPLKNLYIHSIYHFGQLQGYNKGQIYYADGYNNHQIRTSRRDIASGKYMVYYWSDLKPTTIKEENEFDWINEPRNNPLDGLRLTTPMGRLGDGLTIKDDGGTYVTVISSNGSSEYHRGTVKNFIKMGIWLPKESINESDELDWIKDTVTTKLSGNENWILVNDVDRESIAEGHEIQKYLFDLGYDWSALGDFQSLKDFCIYTIYHYGTIKDGNQIFYQDGCRGAEVRISDKDIKSGKYMVYYWSDLKPTTINESDELDWIRKATPSKWDYFEEIIKDEPDINIEKNEDGEWVDLRDSRRRRYFDEGLFDDYGLEEDIKSNSLPDFLNAISQYIEVTFQGYDFESDEDYWDFRTLEEVLEKANKKV